MLFRSYFTLSYSRLTTGQVANEVIRVTTVAKVVQIQDLPKVLKTMWQPAVRVTMTNQPVENAQLLFASDPKMVRDLVKNNPKHLSLSLPLADSRWLNITVHRAEHPWLFSGFMASIVVLTVAIIMLCLWAIQRLAMPIQSLAKAAKRFGMDMNSPPMPTDGPLEAKEVAESFNEMQARIRRLINDRTQMLAAISHDLRTPITRLKLRAEYIKDASQYEKTVEDLNIMDKMIGSILAFARDYDQEEPMEKFDLTALVETLVSDLTDLGHKACFEADTKRLAYFGRMVPLRRAISNLVENAIKYGEQADVLMHAGEDKITIKISDSGPGIADTETEKVFSPFYRVDPARSPEIAGTGLGMAVARDIIRSHGGEIELKNKKPNGLVVLITLPVGD